MRYINPKLIMFGLVRWNGSAWVPRGPAGVEGRVPFKKSLGGAWGLVRHWFWPCSFALFALWIWVLALALPFVSTPKPGLPAWWSWFLAAGLSVQAFVVSREVWRCLRQAWRGWRR